MTMIKRVVCVALILCVLIASAACGQETPKGEPSAPATSVTNNQTDVEITHVADAAYSQSDKGLIAPEIKMTSDDVADINGRIRSLFDELLAEYDEAAQSDGKKNSPTMSYESAAYKDVLSVKVMFSRIDGTESCVTYCCKISTESEMPIAEVIKAAGFTLSNVIDSVKKEREAYMVFADRRSGFASNNAELNEYIMNDVNRYSSELAAETLGTYIDNERNLSLYYQRRSPKMQPEYYSDAFVAKKDARELAVFNPISDAFIAIINSPTAQELENSDYKDSYEDNAGGGAKGTMLVTALNDGVTIRIQEISYDVEQKKAFVGDTMLEQEDMKQGESIRLKAPRPDPDSPHLRISAEYNGYRCDYLVCQYDKYGEPKIEYLSGEKRTSNTIEESDSVIRLAKAIAVDSHLKSVSGNEKYGNDAYWFWSVMSTAVSLYHPSFSEDESGTVVLDGDMLNSYKEALFPQLEAIPIIPEGAVGAGMNVTFDGVNGQYSFAKKTVPQSGKIHKIERGDDGSIQTVVISVSDSEREIITYWKMELVKSSGDNQDKMFNASITSVEEIPVELPPETTEG